MKRLWQWIWTDRLYGDYLGCSVGCINCEMHAQDYCAGVAEHAAKD